MRNSPWVLVRRAALAVWRAIVRDMASMGRLYFPVDGYEPHRPAPHRPARRLDRPPPAHPERLRPDVPLSAVERSLEQRLQHGPGLVEY